MRVTRIMQEYIRDEIRKRVEPRYEEIKNAYKTEQQVLADFMDQKATEFRAVYNDAMDTFLAAHPEYQDDRNDHDREHSVSVSGHYRIRPRKANWEKEMSDEIDVKYKEIVISLELGGTKDDLDELLNNI